MSSPAFHDGKAPFSVPSKDSPCETYYKVYGDLKSDRRPLIILHGGPGSGHEYMEPYSRIWTDYQIPVVFYDQIGCAASTHYPETMGDKSFWQVDLFVAELANLIRHLGIDRPDGPGFDVLGHSWGGIFAVRYAAGQPAGLRRLILAGTNSGAQVFKNHLWKLLGQLPEEHRRAIEEAAKTEDFTTKAYADAMDSFQREFMCRAKPYPHPLLAKARANQAADPTVRVSVQGRSPFLYDGVLENYSSIPLLPKIQVPTLVFNGVFDTAQYVSVVPFFNHIPRVRWVTLPGASHMPHLDSPELLEDILKLVGDFLMQT